MNIYMKTLYRNLNLCNANFFRHMYHNLFHELSTNVYIIYIPQDRPQK